MKRLFTYIVIGLISVMGFGQEVSTQDRNENSAVLAKMQLLQETITKKALSTEGVRPNSAPLSQRKNNSSSSEKAISGAFKVSQGNSTVVKNSFVYKINDSKSKIVPTKPAPKKEATPEMEQAMKAAFGINN